MNTISTIPDKDVFDDFLAEIKLDTATEANETSPSGEKSFHEIYAKLTIAEELILIIDTMDEGKLRKGLSAVKAKHVQKMKESNVPVDNQVLEFIVHPQTEEQKVTNKISVQVVLKKQPGIKVYEVIEPTGI